MCASHVYAREILFVSTLEFHFVRFGHPMATYKCPIAACTIKRDKALFANAVLGYLKPLTGFKNDFRRFATFDKNQFANI
jgi:hypothetical protein